MPRTPIQWCRDILDHFRNHLGAPGIEKVFVEMLIYTHNMDPILTTTTPDKDTIDWSVETFCQKQ